MARFRNPLAAASSWAERMANPRGYAEQKQEEAQQHRMQEAQQPPVPEADDGDVPAPPLSSSPAPVKKSRSFDELRSVVWAGCIMVGVLCSLAAFLIGMIR